MLCISGEPFPTSLAARTLALLPHVTLLNLYGATEVSADVACFKVTREALQIQSHSEMIDSQLPPSQLPAPLYEGNHTLKKSNLHKYTYDIGSIDKTDKLSFSLHKKELITANTKTLLG